MQLAEAMVPGRGENGQDDAALVRAMKRDRSAFALLHRRYVDRIYPYVCSQVGRIADAEDLTARIFTEALEGLEGYRERDTFSGGSSQQDGCLQSGGGRGRPATVVARG